TEPEPWVSEQVTSYFTMNWDMAKTFNAVEGIVDTFAGEGTFNDRFVKEANRNLGIDLREDIINGLNDRFSLAQEQSKAAKPPIEEFEKYLSNSILSGSFTIDGQPLNKLEEERYEIKSAKKLDGDDDLWEIKTRIKYGNKDLTVPVVVTIQWVGRTPMIVLDSVTIPGLGTFSARVVFHDRKYAGTWKHDNVGGHLFGRVEPAGETPKP
ncbi:MAG: hypothetical protein ACKOAH_33150, partial [Pirellula sp.]